jgi:hypothetical protein
MSGGILDRLHHRVHHVRHRRHRGHRKDWLRSSRSGGIFGFEFSFQRNHDLVFRNDVFGCHLFEVGMKLAVSNSFQVIFFDSSSQHSGVSNSDSLEKNVDHPSSEHQPVKVRAINSKQHKADNGQNVHNDREDKVSGQISKMVFRTAGRKYLYLFLKAPTIPKETNKEPTKANKKPPAKTLRAIVIYSRVNKSRGINKYELENGQKDNTMSVLFDQSNFPIRGNYGMYRIHNFFFLKNFLFVPTKNS